METECFMIVKKKLHNRDVELLAVQTTWRIFIPDSFQLTTINSILRLVYSNKTCSYSNLVVSHYLDIQGFSCL